MATDAQREVDLAWAAGLLDGEGCLLLTTAGSPQVTVEMVHKGTILRVKKLLGGTITNYCVAPPHRHRYRWRMASGEAAEVLGALLPYLVTKRAEALVLLKFLPKRAHNRRKRSPRELALVSATRARLSALKREG